MNASAYLRVSGLGQVDGDGFPRQRAAIDKYAAIHGIQVIGEYRDEGISGTTELADRSGLAALLSDLDNNGVTLVLVERADRLARDLIVGELILRQFRERGITVIAVEGQQDLTVADNDPTRKLIRQVLGAVSEFDKSCIVAKLRAARERIRSRDERCEGRKPYGTFPGESAVVERIKSLRADRLTMRAIAARLNDEQAPTRTGATWSAQMVCNILKR